MTDHVVLTKDQKARLVLSILKVGLIYDGCEDVHGGISLEVGLILLSLFGAGSATQHISVVADKTFTDFDTTNNQVGQGTTLHDDGMEHDNNRVLSHWMCHIVQHQYELHVAVLYSSFFSSFQESFSGIRLEHTDSVRIVLSDSPLIVPNGYSTLMLCFSSH